MEHIADNGNSVPLRLCCEALPAQEHLRQLHLISERNPRPEIFKLEFLQPLNTLDLSTRIRLAGTQNLIALAETNQGRVLWVSHHISVTDSACVEGA
jgi:sulfur-oxidizing protein SoxY